MSGGSWDYLYRSLEIPVERLRASLTPERRAFADVLEKVAKALHDIEWVDSGDYGSGDELKAINAVIGRHGVDRLLIREAIEARDRLTEAIKRAKKANNG